MTSHSAVKIVNGYPSIDIGALRHDCTILAPTPVSSPPIAFDAAGAVIQDQTFTTGKMAIEAARGMDVVRAGQTTAQLYLAVALWYQAGILPNMKVRHPNGSVYLIQSVENVLEMNRVLILTCLGLGVND